MTINAQALEELRNKAHEHELKLERTQNSIEHSVSKIANSVENLDNSVGNLNETVASLKETIYGGGQQGSPLFPRVAVLEKQTNFHNDAIKKILEHNEKFLVEDKKHRWKFMSLLYLSVIGISALLFTYATDSKLFEWAVKMFK